MKFKIESSEVIKKGNTNGKDWAMTKMTLIDEQGVKTEGVTTFDTVVTGAEINGEIAQNGQYLNFKQAKAVASANFKQAQVEKSMERKEQSIARFQDDKEFSIMVSSTMRDAVQLAVAEYTINKASFDNLDACVLKWRKWLIDNWGVNKTDIPAF